MTASAHYCGRSACIARKRRCVLAVCAAGLVVAVLVALVWPRRQILCEVTFLPSPVGGRAIPHAINDRGQIVGSARETRGVPRALLWSRNTGYEVATRLWSQQNASRVCINNAGQIAGTIVDPNGDRRALMREPDGTERWLGTLGGKVSRTTAINNVGQIVGWSETGDGLQHAFIWDAAAGMRDLGTLGGRQSRACSINDSGQVTGYAQGSATQWHAFLWDAETGMVALGYGPSGPVARCFINNNGFVVGDFSAARGKRQISSWSKGPGVQALRSFTDEVGVVCPPNESDAFLLMVFRPGYPILRRKLGRGYCSYLWSPGKGFRVVQPHLDHRKDAVFVAGGMNNHGDLVGSIQMEAGGYQWRWGVLLRPAE